MVMSSSSTGAGWRDELDLTMSTSPMHYLPSRDETRRMTTAELRAAFLVSGLFQPGEIVLRHIDLDRVVLGGAMPTTSPLRLDTPASLGADYFTERRELGVLNIGGAGRIEVDGNPFDVAARDVLYIARESRDVIFSSSDASRPARFYLVSYPAHVRCPTSLITRGNAESAELGASERANRRRLARYIHASGAQSAQLVMGVTELQGGSVWNTMPAHTHHRRTEVYLYFDLPADAMVVHLMGEPEESRHLIVRDGEVVLSPGWSIHAGAGTASYSFCWAMGGENKDFADMQMVDINNLR
jgi:4-deoxy-L-threo-5-hexosulose-uronate ketol-isomerase